MGHRRRGRAGGRIRRQRPTGERRGQARDPATGRRCQGDPHGAVRAVGVRSLRFHPEDGDEHPVEDDRCGPPGARGHTLALTGAMHAMPAAPKDPTAPAEPPMAPLILLDGMSLAFRAYFALPPDLSTSAGVVTNAVHGFASMVVNLVRDHRPVGLAVAFDLPGGTFRDDIVDDYKGGRAETPPDLPPQFDMIRSLLGSLAIPVVDAEGFEADDVLATLASEARDRGHPVIIVTGDRDSYQLVEDPYIRVLYNRRGVSDYSLYDEAGIEERTGVEPAKYPLLASLRGDPSDNLPGVPGVGEKTAAKLINEYGDLDTLYAHLDALSPKLRQNLAEHAERVRLNAEVIPLVRDVPLDCHVDDLVLGGWRHEDARTAFAALEMRGAWGRFESAMRDGLLGEPAEGDSPPGAPAGQVSTAEGTAEPEWLTAPDCTVPTSVPSALDLIDELVDTARVQGRAVALAPLWEGDPGRSPLLALALVAEPTAPQEQSPGVYLGPHEDGPLVSDPAVLAALAAAVGPDGLGVVAHDAKELMRSLLPLGVDVTGLAMDTAVAAYLLDPSVDQYRLSDLAARHLQVTVDDGTATRGQGAFLLDPSVEEDGAGEAAASDLDHTGLGLVRLAAVLARLRRPLVEALVEVGEDKLFDDMERPLVRVLARMEVVGIPVDREVLRSIATELTTECATLESTMHELAGTPFNVNSVKQLRTVLYEDLGLSPGRKTKTGFSTDARTLESLRGQHPIIEVLLRYREVEKLRSTYGESLAAEVAADGRIHATFRQTVARTGRLSSDRPNLHNIPVSY